MRPDITVYELTDSDATGSEEDDDEVVGGAAGQSSGFPTLTSWKKEFGRSINAIETFGDVAWSKHYSNLMLPGLEVGGIHIPLPLIRPRDAEVIRKACHRAPFGRGDETVVDESVRKTWEVGHEGFSFSNPKWAEYVQALLDVASVELGMPHNARAEPYKLLLYDPGSFFKPHKDSEKAPGMIATLVICLPSAHDGGDVHVSHSGQRYVLKTSQDSAFELTALAWYSDVTHEVKEITSGHRLVITYNIVLDGNPSSKPSAGGVVQQQVALESMLKSAHIRYPHATRLLYPLAHKYSETSLSLHTMKGDDRARVYALQKACASSGYLLLLANTTKSRTGFEDEGSDFDDVSHELTHVATCDGAQAAVIVRKEDLADFLDIRSLSRDNVASNVAKLVVKTFYDTTDPAPRVAVELLKQLVAQPKRRMGKTLSEMLSFAIETGDFDLWNEVFTNAVLDFGRPDPTFGSYRSYNYSRPYGYSHYDFQDSWALGSLTPVLSRLASHLNKNRMGRLQGDWDKYLGRMVMNLPTLDDVDTALGSLARDLKIMETRQSLQEWSVSVADTRFKNSTSRLQSKDCSMILRLLDRGKGIDWVNDSLLPALKDRADKSLLLTLAPTLLDRAATQDTKAIAKGVFWGTVDQLEVDASDLVPAVESSYSMGRGQSHWSEFTDVSRYRESRIAGFMHLARKCMLHGLWDEADRVIDICCSSVAEAHKRPVLLQQVHGVSRGYNVSYVPHKWAEMFLADVVDTIHQSGRPAPASLKPFFESLVRHYVLAEIGPFPKKPVGWAHKRRECPGNTYVIGDPDRCRDSGACRELNDFLASRTEQTHRFSMVGKLRDHIQSRLPAEQFHCQTVKSGSPYTLVVTKLGTEYPTDLQQHIKDIGNLEKRLLAFRTPCVQAALGDELYAELVLLNDIRKPPGNNPDERVPLVHTQDGPAPSVLAQGSGNKRPGSVSFDQPGASRMRLSSIMDY
ncbi:hypothetical protein PG991_013161 [Apiospora marii]|uniref:Prolyl 4-hydroxylase alpha subunit Fe(2+) 2OG dioxygenase domain-containing protein n=1 Tax=Apiospora marii TaxID=335849 RepID=A0ABR1R587_9PEZI